MYSLGKRAAPFKEPPLRLFRESRCILVFVSGKNAEQVAVDKRAERLGAVAVIAQAGGGEDCRSFQMGLVLQLLKRGQGKPISAVQLVESLKKLGFELSVRAAARRLRQGIGAYSFMNSHGLPDLLSGELRLGRVRCFCTGRCPIEQLAIGQMVGSYFFLLGLRVLCGTGAFAGASVLANCFL